MNETSVRPGWYPAAHANGELRWWDGLRWVEPPRKKKSLWWVWVIVGVLVVTSAGGVGTVAAVSGALSSDYSAKTVAEIPAGYEDAGDGVAVRWAEPAEESACVAGWALCATLMVYAYEPCNLYVKANIVDAGRVVIGYDNELTGNLSAGQYAKAQFTTLDDAAEGFQFVEASCY